MGNEELSSFATALAVEALRAEVGRALGSAVRWIERKVYGRIIAVYLAVLFAFPTLLEDHRR